ncbi:MAG: carbohydrate kinase [Spirochaetales bacterium]|nr:carbohydrate kinase [Spirochaetales bacterium]
MKTDVICLGELLIDFVSEDRDATLEESTGFKKAPGGAPANVAVGVVKLGKTAGFIGKVGNDPFGIFLKKVLVESNVDTTSLVFDDYARTTLSFVAQKSSGVRDCMFYRNPGADMLLSESEIRENYFRGAGVFHFGSISLGSEKSRAATMKALEYARENALLVSYDPNLRLSLWNDEDTAFKEINTGFELSNIVKISDEEFGMITRCKTHDDCAKYILDKGAKLVIITLGEKGCYYNDGKSRGIIPGFKVPFLESTGAGDAFMAGLLVKLADRLARGIDEAVIFDREMAAGLRFANAAGALAVTKLGAIPSLPLLEEVEQLLAENGA